MLEDCCLCRTCCCGRDLGNGVFSWAVIDILFHFLIFPLPLLMTDICYYANSLEFWLVLVIVADIAVILGQKSGKPGFLLFWMVIIGINILMLFGIWVAIGLIIYYLDFAHQSIFFISIKSVNEIYTDQYKFTLTAISLFFLLILPFTYIYFWLVVRSLRKRLIMEHSINFNPNRVQIMTVEEKAEYIRMEEMQREAKRQEEIKMAMAVLVMNMRRDPAQIQGSNNPNRVGIY